MRLRGAERYHATLSAELSQMLSSDPLLSKDAASAVPASEIAHHLAHAYGDRSAEVRVRGVCLGWYEHHHAGMDMQRTCYVCVCVCVVGGGCLQVAVVVV